MKSSVPRTMRPSGRKSGGGTVAERLSLAQARLLLQTSETMAAHESLDQMLGVLVEVATKELNAERATIFLCDKESNELYSRVAIGNFQREIRIMSHSGVAGHVFTSGQSAIVHDAYADEHFNRSVDEQTGYVTKSILCVPILTVKGEIIGVAQVLNKREGQFTRNDQALLAALTTQAAIALQSMQILEQMKRFRDQEREFYRIVSDITSEIDLGILLNKVMQEATRMLNAERSTLFLNDERRQELFSKVGQGLEARRDPLSEQPGDRRRHLSVGGVREDSPRLRRPALQPVLRQEDRLLHPLHPVRSGGQ